MSRRGLRQPLPERRRARRSEGGQALLLALVVLALLAMVAAAWTAFWFRAASQEARTAAARQAFYAAESAVAEAERAFPAMIGSEGCSNQPRSGTFRIGRATAIWQALCNGATSWTVRGTGTVPVGRELVRRTVQVQLALNPVFQGSIFAGNALTLDDSPNLVWPLNLLCFKSGIFDNSLKVTSAYYGRSVTTSNCVQGSWSKAPPQWQVPDVPFSGFAQRAFGGQKWLGGSSSVSVLDPGRWYDQSQLIGRGTLEVRGPGFVGVRGDIPGGVSLQIDPDAILVVTGNVQIDQLTIQLGPISTPGGTGAGLLVAGGNVNVNQLVLFSIVSLQDYQINVLALTVPQGCQEAWCTRDQGNNITVNSVSQLGLFNPNARTHVFLYSAPMADNAQSSISLDVTSFADVVSGMTIQSSVVTPGNVAVTYRPGVEFLSPFSIVPDANGLLRFLPLLGQGVWTQMSWKEGS